MHPAVITDKRSFACDTVQPPQSAFAKKDRLEHWLTERYCLYTTHRDQVLRGEVHHQQWPLQEAAAEFETNTVAAAAGIELPTSPPSLLFARRLEVLIWPLHPAH